jgi:hypothetical protein
MRVPVLLAMLAVLPLISIRAQAPAVGAAGKEAAVREAVNNYLHGLKMLQVLIIIST